MKDGHELLPQNPYSLAETYNLSPCWCGNALQQNATQEHDCNRLPQIFTATLYPASCQLHSRAVILHLD